jgi:tRNA pseudouridine38-40 synthase
MQAGFEYLSVFVFLRLTFYPCLSDVTTFTRYCARVAYDGTGFFGWQSIPNKRTVQGTINNVLSNHFDSEVRSVAASRTDKGVHARGNIIHFDLPSGIELNDAHLRQINEQLSSMGEVVLCQVHEAPLGLLPIQRTCNLPWHAMENSIAKHYSYLFSAEAIVPPVLNRYCATVYNHNAPSSFDITKFNDALLMFNGTHDFQSFGNKLEERARVSEEHSGRPFSSVRTVTHVSITELRSRDYPFVHSDVESMGPRINRYKEAPVFRVDIVLSGALYKMIRNIIGGCTAVAYGSLQQDELLSLLEKPSSRTTSGYVTAPAHGLCLEKVFYREKLGFFENL